MGINESIVIGVISGVAASAIVSIVVANFRKVIIPWYLEKTYKGRDISGKWETNLEQGEVREEIVMNITQKANNLSGFMTITGHGKGNNTGITVYKMSGIYNERLVYLMGENINKKEIGVDVGLFEVIDGGKKMKGIEAWYSVTKNKIDSSEIEWVKSL